MMRVKFFVTGFSIFLFFAAGLHNFAAVHQTVPEILAEDSQWTQRQSDYYRTDLYFGRSIPTGGLVSDEEWEKFLAEVVTPRFPDGFTIVKATGQYREKTGKIDKEPSDVLIFLYPKSRVTASRRKIEEIRRAYIRQFKQESVLRLDFRQPLHVSF